MLDHSYNEENILSFYNIATLEPRNKHDLNLTPQEYLEPEELLNLSTEDQFDTLSRLVNLDDDGRDAQYNYNNKDLEDPLRGRGTNIVKQLINKKIVTSTNDSQLTNYLITSQNFNSKQFLTQVHKDTPIDELFQSLQFLERNIHSQTNELKGVMDANFVKFLDCKKAIDDVLVSFKSSKTNAQKERENLKVFNPQRHGNVNKNETLLSELEESINNLNTTSALMIRPIIDNKSKELKISKLIEFVKAHQFLFDLPGNLIKYVTDHNHDQFIEDYHKFLNEKHMFLKLQEKRYNEELSKLEGKEEHIANLQQEQLLINTALSKVFHEVDSIIDQYRKKTFKELLSLDHEVSDAQTIRSGGAGLNSTSARFIALVDKLYQLDGEREKYKAKNPIFEFLSVQLQSLEDELDYQIKKVDSKWAIMQKKLVDYVSSLPDVRQNGSHVKYIGDKYNTIEDYFRASSTTTIQTTEERLKVIIEVFESSENLDLSIINETWLILNNFISYVSGLFLKNLSKFINNYVHYNKFSIDPKGLIRGKFFALIDKICVVLVTLFDDESGDNNQLESTPKNYRQFLPEYTNSLSAIFYLLSINFKLNDFLTNAGECVGTIGNISNSADTNKYIKLLRNTSGKVNQKIAEAVCSVWVNDCSQVFDLEKWDTINHGEWKFENSGNDDGATFTKLMNIIEFYQDYILVKLSQMLFTKETTSSEFRIIASHPSKRMLVSIEIQFMRSLNIIVDSIMKRYTLERESNEEGTFKILTMNNFDKLSREVYPRLIKKFDKTFSKDLLKQNLKLFADIDKASLTIFDDILNKEKLWVSLRVHKFFNSPIEGAGSGLKIDAFIYDVLIHFVKIIHTVKPITGHEIFISIINELQMGFLKNTLDNVRSSNTLRPIVLVNLKLDVNFFMEVFEISKSLRFNDQTFKLLEILLNAVEEKLGSDGDYSKKEFKAILEENLRDSENQFDCF